MKFSTALSVALFALAKMVIADSEEFGLVSIRSGSDLQYLSVYSDNGTLKLGSGSGSFEATITDDGKLKFDDDKYAVVNEDGSFKEGSESDAATGFSIKDGHLNYKSSSGFYASRTGRLTFSLLSNPTTLPVLRLDQLVRADLLQQIFLQATLVPLHLLLLRLLPHHLLQSIVRV